MLGATYTVLAVANPQPGGATQRTVAEVEAEWQTGGGTEHDQSSYRRALGLAADPDFQPELLFVPTQRTHSGFQMMDGIHRAAALYSQRNADGTMRLDLPVFVLPRTWPG